MVNAVGFDMRRGYKWGPVNIADCFVLEVWTQTQDGRGFGCVGGRYCKCFALEGRTHFFLSQYSKVQYRVTEMLQLGAFEH